MVDKLFSSSPTNIKNVNTLSENFAKQTHDVQNMLLDAYNSLFNGDITTASAYIKNARSKDVNNIQVKESEKLLTKWIDIFRQLNQNEKYSYEDKADCIIKEWYAFLQSYNNIDPRITRNQNTIIPKNGKEAFQKYIISYAKELYLQYINEHPDKRNTSEFRIKFFHCLKLLGEYEKAISFLESCFPHLSIHKKAYILSHLADCHEYLKYNDNAKVFFRKAFELSPSSIKIEEIQSQMLHDIMLAIKEGNRYIEQYYQYWIPVYGYIMGFFNIKVKLSPIEVSNITQEIYSLEIKLQDIKSLGNDDPAIILPIFLSRIFLLFDYYSLYPTHNNSSKELLQRIARYDPFIFEKWQGILKVQQEIKTDTTSFKVIEQ